MSPARVAVAVLRSLPVTLLLVATWPPHLARAGEFVPADPAQIPEYSAMRLPCTVGETTFAPNPAKRATVTCDVLERASLRELAIRRSTIFARYGFEDFGATWMTRWFGVQKWYAANPRFDVKQLSAVDRENAHLIAIREQSLTEPELERRRDDLLARRGKSWPLLPTWTMGDGSLVKSCSKPKGAVSGLRTPEEADAFPACRYAKQSWYRPDPQFGDDKLSDEDRVELALLARALGDMATPDTALVPRSLDEAVPMDEWKALTRHELGLVRATIEARRGKPASSPLLREHFGSLGCCSTRDDYSPSLLQVNDRINLGLIDATEKRTTKPVKGEKLLTDPLADGPG